MKKCSPTPRCVPWRNLHVCTHTSVIHDSAKAHQRAQGRRPPVALCYRAVSARELCTSPWMNFTSKIGKNPTRIPEMILTYITFENTSKQNYLFLGIPTSIIWASLVAQLVKNPPAMQETWVQSLGWEDPLEEGMATHSSIFAGRIPWTEEPGGL